MKPTTRNFYATVAAVFAAAVVMSAGMLRSGPGPSVASAAGPPVAATGDPAPAKDPLFLPAPGPPAEGPARLSKNVDRGVHISGLRRGKVPAPSAKKGTYVAHILIKTAVRRRPGGKPFWAARIDTKWSRTAQMLMILKSRRVKGRMWLKLRLPTRPNHTNGWLPRDRVQIIHSPHYIVIKRSQRMLRVYRKGKVVNRTPVVIGKRSTPTPLGLFAIYDRVKQRNRRGFIGPWAVPLTAHSNVLRRYDGGPGLVALHGRAGASFLDPLRSARSHGCVRMNNSRIHRIIKLRKGTAVRIRQ